MNITKRDRLYVEMQCTGCKRPHMVTREALQDPSVIKRCPHCLSHKVHATGMLGFTATNGEIRNAVEMGLELRKDHDDREVHQTATEAAKHLHPKRIGTVLNPGE